MSENLRFVYDAHGPSGESLSLHATELEALDALTEAWKATGYADPGDHFVAGVMGEVLLVDDDGDCIEITGGWDVVVREAGD